MELVSNFPCFRMKKIKVSLYLRLEGEETSKYRCVCRPSYGKVFFKEKFFLKTPFLSEFGLKNKNCQFKLKFGT